jgi:hypothetical protein
MFNGFYRFVIPREFALFPSRGQRFMSLLKHSDPLWGPSNVVFCLRRGLYARGQSDIFVKLTTHTPPSNAGDKNEWSWVSTFPYAYVARTGDKFAFT